MQEFRRTQTSSQRLGVFGALVVFFLVLRPSDAVSATSWQIEGRIEIVDAVSGEIPTLTGLGVVAGAPFTLRITFEERSDSDPSDNNSSFRYPFTYASLDFSGLEYLFDERAPVGANSISHSLRNGVGLYLVSLPLRDAPLATFRFAILTLYDSNLSELDGNSFLTHPPDLNQLDPFDLQQSISNRATTQLTVVGVSEGSAFTLKSSLSSITLVPEPSTALLTVLGLAILSGRRRITSP